MVQRCGVGGAQEEEQYLVCSSTKRALALKTQQALTSQPQHSGEDRCRRRSVLRRRSGDESVVWPLARGLTSGWEIPHGDSGHEPVSCRRCGRPRARAKPCTMHTLRGLELNLCNLYTSNVGTAHVRNCKRTVTGRPRGPVRSPHSRPGQSERAAGPGRATRVRTRRAREESWRTAEWFSRC